MWFSYKKHVINFAQELPHKLLNDTKFTILGNEKILGKSTIFIEVQSIHQSLVTSHQSLLNFNASTTCFYNLKDFVFNCCFECYSFL